MNIEKNKLKVEEIKNLEKPQELIKQVIINHNENELNLDLNLDLELELPDSDIVDIRKSKDFQNLTFSKFKRSEVLKELLKNLINSKIEDSCYWSIELICSGHFKYLWEVFVEFYTTYIHMGNVKISIYLERIHQQFTQIIKQGYQHDILSLRNHPKIRLMFGELICILCSAKKKHCFSLIKLERMDYDWIHLKEHLKAPNTDFVKHILLQDDPQSLLMPLNEFAYHIHQSNKNTMEACYWVEWIIGFDAFCQPKLKCERRCFAPVEPNHQMEIIWIIWGALLHEAKTRTQTPLLYQIMRSLLYLFGMYYTTNSVKKRKTIIYFAIGILCDPLEMDECIRIMPLDKIDIMDRMKHNIDYIYRQLKHNEEAPDMNYLMEDNKTNRLNKMLNQLDKLDQIDAVIRKQHS